LEKLPSNITRKIAVILSNTKRYVRFTKCFVIFFNKFEKQEKSIHNTNQQIPLYGYGGCGKVKVTDTFKDASGKMWLSFGALSSETTVLTSNITLQNVGDLSSFAKIKVVPKGLAKNLIPFFTVTYVPRLHCTNIFAF